MAFILKHLTSVTVIWRLGVEAQEFIAGQDWFLFTNEVCDLLKLPHLHLKNKLGLEMGISQALLEN